MNRSKLTAIHGAKLTRVGLCFCSAGGILSSVGSPMQGAGSRDPDGRHSCRGDAAVCVRTVEEP